MVISDAVRLFFCVAVLVGVVWLSIYTGRYEQTCKDHGGFLHDGVCLSRSILVDPS